MCAHTALRLGAWLEERIVIAVHGLGGRDIAVLRKTRCSWGRNGLLVSWLRHQAGLGWISTGRVREQWLGDPEVLE